MFSWIGSIEATLAANVDLKRPLAAAFNEEGSLPTGHDVKSCLRGRNSVESVLEVEETDGTIVGEELERMDTAELLLSWCCLPCFVELHIEQGPVLDNEAVQIGVVEGVRGSLGRT